MLTNIKHGKCFLDKINTHKPYIHHLVLSNQSRNKNKKIANIGRARYTITDHNMT